MKKALWLFSLLLPATYLHAQKGADKGQLAVEAGVELPVGRFANSHWIGGGAGASSATTWISFYKQHRLRFAWSGGVAYYTGKKEMVSGYAYTYPGYFAGTIMAGGMYSPARKTAFRFTAGPALTVYNGIKKFAFSSRLDLHYHLDKKWAISPGITMLKEDGAGPFWSASLRAVLAL